MTDVEKLKMYREGFKDGWNEAMKQNKMYDYPSVPAAPWPNMGCNVCGRIGPNNLVCYNPKCPSRVTC